MPPYVSQGLKYPLKQFVSICLPVHLFVCSDKLYIFLKIRNEVKLADKFLWEVFLSLTVKEPWKEPLSEKEMDFVMSLLSFISKMWPLS